MSPPYYSDFRMKRICSSPVSLCLIIEISQLLFSRQLDPSNFLNFLFLFTVKVCRVQTVRPTFLKLFFIKLFFYPESLFHTLSSSFILVSLKTS